jgi:hypothetical protein
MLNLTFIFLFHTIADFCFQHRWMAINKSRSNLALIAHVLTYGVVFGSLCYWLLQVDSHVFYGFLLFNVMAHLITDAITSRIAAFFFVRNLSYFYYVTLGVDQLIHNATILWSLRLFFRWSVGVME